MLHITKIRQNYKDLLKNQPFYSSKIESAKQKDKEISNIKFLSELPFFSKEPKELTNVELSKQLPFPSKKTKRPKRLTKYQILQNTLPLYHSVGKEFQEGNMLINIVLKLIMLKLQIE